MLRAAVLIILLSSSAMAQQPEVLIMGGRNQDEFIGCLTCGDFDSDSVWNKFSRHGWGNKFGTWNQFGEHKGQFGSNSACNEFASNPPVLVDRRGNYFGELTVNQYRNGSVCGASGNQQLCRALKVMCSDR